jgi:hypothetical protein
MRKQFISLLALATLLFALLLAPAIDADTWDKKTVVTFDQDVEIPGQVLPAGTYVFKLFGSNSNRYIVQVWAEGETQLLATLMTLGNSYPNPSGKSYFVLDMTGTDEGYPPAIVSWFFAGSDGRDFIYPAYSTTKMVNSQEAPDSQPAPESQELPQSQPQQ